MAHAQLKGVVEDIPGSVTAELETLDPLRLLDLGVDPERSVSLYRTLYKYARKCAESHDACATRCPRSVPTPPPSSSTTCGASTPPRGNPPRAPLSPRRLSARRNCPRLARRRRGKRARLELGEIKDELAATTAARDDAAAEAASLRPFPTQLETQTTRANRGDGTRRVESSRGSGGNLDSPPRNRRGASSWRRERRRESRGGDQAALRAEMTSARATAEETLFAEKRRAAEALAEPTSRLARWERRGRRRRRREDAKKITGALRADIAFLREQRGGAEAEKQAALLRAREAEDREAKGAAIAKAAKARAEGPSDARRAESRANAAEERYATATARSLC